MGVRLTFELEGEMTQYASDIDLVVRVMLRKLQKNTHKGRWENMSVEQAFDLLAEEVLELKDAIEDDSPSDAVMDECADVSNFAMIIATIVNRSRP